VASSSSRWYSALHDAYAVARNVSCVVASAVPAVAVAVVVVEGQVTSA
jgi:hypothetical protein